MEKLKIKGYYNAEQTFMTGMFMFLFMIVFTISPFAPDLVYLDGANITVEGQPQIDELEFQKDKLELKNYECTTELDVYKSIHEKVCPSNDLGMISNWLLGLLVGIYLGYTIHEIKSDGDKKKKKSK